MNYERMWKELVESIALLVCEGEIIHVSDLERTMREIEADGKY